jgi:hypothetical protein
MTDSFERRVAAWLRDGEVADPDEVSGLARYAASIPRHRAAGWRGSAVAFAAALGVASLAILGAGFLVSSHPAPTTTRPAYPITTSNPRFASCGGGSDGVVAAFPVSHASDIKAHIPRMGISPELDSPEPAFVVVFDESHRWATLGGLRPLSSPRPSLTPQPNHVDVCVWLGDLEHGDFMSYADVDITGMRAPIPSEAPGAWPPAEVAPGASCGAMPPAATVVSCPSAFAIGSVDARVDRAWIWLTTLSAATTALEPDRPIRVAGDTTVWLIVYDGFRTCCPPSPDENQSPAPEVQVTRWLVAVDATGRFPSTTYFLDWSGRRVPATMPASGAEQ